MNTNLTGRFPADATFNIQPQQPRGELPRHPTTSDHHPRGVYPSELADEDVEVTVELEFGEDEE